MAHEKMTRAAERGSGMHSPASETKKRSAGKTRARETVKPVGSAAISKAEQDRPVTRVIRPGDTSKPDPFTICIVSNPALETPWNSGAFTVDPITSNQGTFDACANYIERSLFGLLPGQAEKFVADPSVASKIRIVSLFVSGLGAIDANCLVAQDGLSDIVVARRTVFVPFLARYALRADVVYAVTDSRTHKRASAWFTSDDDGRAGVPFVIDGVALNHRYYCLIPGTVAIHSGATSLTAVHEFGHALSSYTNGSIVDLYVDDGPGLNSKRGRPIPSSFATYAGHTFASDTARDGLGYPPGWQSYHCELIDSTAPALMDDYWSVPTGLPERCAHDRITRQFLLDRLRAKSSR